MSLRRSGLISVAAVLLLGGCSGSGPSRPATGSGGTTGAAGNTSSSGGDTGGGGTTGTAGSTDTGGGGTTTGAGGSSAAGTTGTAGTIGTAGTTGASGGSTGTAGTTGAAGATGAGGGDPPAPRPINVTGTGTFSKNLMYFNKDKTPVLGKLILYLGGIGGGPGSGGIDAFAHMYGFHNFMPATQTNLTGGSVPAMYKAMLTDNDPTNDAEANRQVGDARADLWDGKGRVTWNKVAPGASILEETIAAIKYGMANDPGGDWGYYLNADGTLRTSDVWVVGYSWGSQTWAMISPYVRFGRVITTSGPVNEGWPNGKWMTDPSLTPNDRKYLLVSDGQVNDIAPNCIKAGWPGTVTMVTLTMNQGPFTAEQHLFELIGGNGGISPGGHTVFCTDNVANLWIPVCKHVFGQ
jgi:hypothetical protein